MKRVVFATIQIFAVLIYFGIPKTVSAQVVINEFVSNSATEWVEFYNSSNSADYLKNYYIDDDENFTEDIGSKKKLLSDLNIGSIKFPYIDLTSFLNNSGDSVVLFDQTGRIIDKYSFTSDPGKEVSIGRNPDNTGNFSILTAVTKGSENAGSATPTAVPMPTPTKIATPKPITPNPNNSVISKTNTPVPTKSSEPIVNNFSGIRPSSSAKSASEQKIEDLGIKDLSNTFDTKKVLGISDELSSDSAQSSNNNFLLGVLLIACGIVLALISIFMAYKILSSRNP